jgi:ATP-binding cassette, subfamily B, multidrug efflux pump
MNAINEKEMKQQHELKHMVSLLWPMMRPYKKWLIWALIATPLGVIAQTLKPILIQYAIDKPILNHDIPGIITISSYFFLTVLLGFIFKAMGTYYLQIAGLRTLANLRHHVFQHVLTQSPAFFDQKTTGSLMTRTTQDVDAISESLNRGIVGLVADALIILGTLGAMLWLDATLTVIAFSISPILIWLVNTCRKQLRDLFASIRKHLSDLNGLFAEYIYGSSEVQRYGAAEQAQKRFNNISYDFMKLYHKANWWDAGLYAVMDGLSALSVSLIVAFVAYQIDMGVTESVSIGVLVAMIDSLNRIYIPIREFSGRLANIQRSLAALDRILSLMNENQKIKQGLYVASHAQGHVRFDNVSFRYQANGPWIFQNVSFEMKPGEVLALVGATGSGKSTIARLLQRQYQNYEGEIFLDEVNLKKYRLSSIRSNMSAVHQDPYLFKATIAENIHLWNPSLQANQKLVKQAARQARIATWIESLPLKYETICADRGQDLSAGQRQLITIARSFARETPLVILDEATASVDALTEQWIDEATSELFAQKTVLVIAHRLSTIAKADRILLLEKGQIIAQGSFEELVDRLQSNP